MENLSMECEKLAQALADYTCFRDEIGKDGIGRLSEKSLHGVLKFYFDPDPSHHEIVLCQGPVADVFDGESVVEIQTGNYAFLQKKLPRILPHYPVRVVCPIVRNRSLCTLDTVTGDVIGCRKSPVHGNRTHALTALAYLERFLEDANFTLTFMLVDTEEYRVDSRQKGTKRRKYTSKAKKEKLDCIPTAVVDVWNVRSRKDYWQMIPDSLKGTFTASDFYKAAHLRGRKGSLALKVLRESDCVKMIGKQGKAYLYTKNEKTV